MEKRGNEAPHQRGFFIITNIKKQKRERKK